MFLAAWVLLFFPLMAFLLAGYRRLGRSTRLDDAQCMPVTVIVSARNEERDLPGCIESLAALDYPAGKLQIVLVDDRSTDATPAIVDEAARTHANLIALHSASLPPNGLEAKARGIAHGFAHSTGEWVLITDADARVPAQWVRHLLGRVTPRTGMVGGSVVVDDTGATGIVERVSWGFTQIFSFGMAGWNASFICLGPNMGIRRSVYTGAGGLEGARFHVAEDLALFTMVTAARMQVQAYADAETTVTLRPVPSAHHLLSQQRRGLGGGVAQSAVYSIPLLLAFGWGFGLCAYVLLGWLIDWRWWLAFVMAKAVLDGALLFTQQQRLQMTRHLRYLWVIELYHVFIFLMLPLSFLFSRKIRWMGDGYADSFS